MFVYTLLDHIDAQVNSFLNALHACMNVNQKKCILNEQITFNSIVLHAIAEVATKMCDRV